MILGIPTPTFTLIHVVISLIGIVAGCFAVAAMVRGKLDKNWTIVFLTATVFTSLTGFLFPFTKFGPPHAFGVISLPLLALAVIGLYRFRLKHQWRWIYIVTALVALYLNVVVAIVQSFQKIPALKTFAPTQSEPPFLVVQLIALAAFVILGFQSVKKFRPR
jgi:hypothetical protein